MASVKTENKSVVDLLVKNGLLTINDGEVDWDLTFSNIREKAESEIANIKQSDSLIGGELDKIFSQLGDQPVTLNAITSLASQRLCSSGSIEFSKFEVTRLKVANYIKNSSCYEVSRGRNGGVRKIG